MLRFIDTVLSEYWTCYAVILYCVETFGMAASDSLSYHIFINI